MGWGNVKSIKESKILVELKIINRVIFHFLCSSKENEIKENTLRASSRSQLTLCRKVFFHNEKPDFLS